MATFERWRMVKYYEEIDSGFLLDSTPDKFATTNKTGFKSVVALGNRHATLNYWHGEKETVSWSYNYVFIKGKPYKAVADDDYYKSIEYAFIKSGYLVLIMYDYITYSYGIRLLLKSALVAGTDFNPFEFEQYNLFNGLNTIYSWQVNKSATALIILGEDSSTPATGLPPDLPPDASVLGSGSGLWRSILRYSFATVTTDDTDWITSGARSDFFNRHIVLITTTIAVSNTISINTETGDFYTGMSYSREFSCTGNKTTTFASSTVYNTPIPISAVFDSLGNEAIAYFNSNWSGESSTVYTSVIEHSFAKTAVTETPSNLATAAEFINYQLTGAYSDNTARLKSVTFRGMTADYGESFADKGAVNDTFYSFALDENKTTYTWNRTTSLDYRNANGIVGGSPYAGVFMPNQVARTYESKTIDIYASPFVDDVIFITQTYFDDASVGVGNRTVTTSNDDSSKRAVFDIQFPAATVQTLNGAVFVSDSTTDTDSLTYETPLDYSDARPIDGYWVVEQPNSLTINKDYQYIAPPEAFLREDESVFGIKLVFESDRHGNMIYALNNELVSPAQTGCKIYKTNFAAESPEKQAEISAIVSTPSQILGVV